MAYVYKTAEVRALADHIYMNMLKGIPLKLEGTSKPLTTEGVMGVLAMIEVLIGNAAFDPSCLPQELVRTESSPPVPSSENDGKEKRKRRKKKKSKDTISQENQGSVSEEDL
jgi:hypothetical protein